MDFGKALILIALVLVLTDYVKQLVPTLDSRLTTVAALLIGIGATFLVAESVWGNDNIIGGEPLDTMDAASKVVVGLMLAGGAGLGDKILNAVRNIGENQGTRPPSE